MRSPACPTYGILTHLWDYGSQRPRYVQAKPPAPVARMDNSIPALERAFGVLQALFEAPEGLTPRTLVEHSGIPRTTLYRILRLLLANGYVATTSDGSAYVLGPTFLRMAGRVPLGDDLAARAQPVLQRLTADFSETVKIVVRDHLESMTIAVIHPRVDARITSYIGSRMPLHVGAAQRLLLSRAPGDVVEAVLSQPLRPWGINTITRPRELRRMLKELAQRDWEFSSNEGPKGIATVAALIREHGQPPRAVVSMVFAESGRTEKDIRAMREAVRGAAHSLSTA